MALVNVQYRLQLMESERGWGRNYWYEYYDARKEAEKRRDEVNARNTADVAPDWYMKALEIDIVEKIS